MHGRGFEGQIILMQNSTYRARVGAAGRERLVCEAKACDIIIISCEEARQNMQIEEKKPKEKVWPRKKKV